MANSLEQVLNLIGTVSTVSDRPSYIEDPEDILNQIWYEQSIKMQPALEATRMRASATIGPKETGPIEDVVGGFYASNKLAPIAAFIDDMTPGIPFVNIIPDPPDELPDGGNRMRNALNAIVMAEALPAIKKLGVSGYNKLKKVYENLEYTKNMPVAARTRQALNTISPINLYRLKAEPIKTLKETVGYRLLQAQKEAITTKPISQTFKIKPDSKWLKIDKPRPEIGWKGGGKLLDPKLKEQGWQLHWDKDGQGYVTRLTKRGKKAVDEARYELFNALSSEKEWNKFRKTYDDLINPAQYDEYVNIPRTYKQYQAFLKDRLITNYDKRIGDIKLAPSTGLSALVDEPQAVGRFTGSNLGWEGESAIAMATKHPKDYFKSVLKHELKHYLDFGIDKHKGKVYEDMSSTYQGMMKNDVFEALGHWKIRQSMALKKYKSDNPMWEMTGIPVDLVPINPSLKKALYLAEPTEISARIAQIKSKTNIEKLQDVLGVRNFSTNPNARLHQAERDLLEIFDQKTVDKLKKTVWGGAAPFILEDEVYEDLK